ncbi:MAG: transcriptional regulator FNR [Gammaproteobacteria bacterium]|nr:MAG: transcriptional regulator FNR [Gammaproteobacteria bacterium]
MQSSQANCGASPFKELDLHKIKVSCSNCSLSELCLPRGMGQGALEKLEDIVKRSSPLQKGEVLFRAGDKFRGIYAVRSGLVKVFATADDGEEQIIGFFLPGEMLGLDAIDSQVHACNAVALETSTYCAVPFSELSEVCKEIPELQNQLFKIMSRELSVENQMLLTLGKKNSEEKVATFLLTISSRYHQLGFSAKEFKLTMSRQEIGNYLGITFETVSRVFGRLQRNGIIKVNRKAINILDMVALKNLVSGCDN